MVNELSGILSDHAEWLNGVGGERANLSGANLKWENLSGANLRGANLRWADCRWGDFSGADLKGAKLSGGDFSGGDFSGADLRAANLRRANFSGANFSGAKLGGADLREADLRRSNIIILQFEEHTAYIGPEETIIGCQRLKNTAWESMTSKALSAMNNNAMTDYYDKYHGVILAAIHAVESSAITPRSSDD